MGSEQAVVCDCARAGSFGAEHTAVREQALPQRTHGFQEERQQERLCSTALVASGTGEQRTGCIKKEWPLSGHPFFPAGLGSSSLSRVSWRGSGRSWRRAVPGTAR